MARRPGGHALVTGGSRGLGPVIAAALVDDGMDVTLAARSASRLAEAAASIAVHSSRIETVAADLRDEAARTSLVAQAEERLGPVDVLVNNAAVDHYRAFRNKAVEEMREEIETNLLAPLHLTSLVLEGMLERDTGHIVNIASLAAKVGIACEATYSATKAGLLEWANALRAELHGTGVGVSVILPTVISDVGVFSRQGVRPPRLAAPVPSERVARAVLRAIRDDVPEIIVTPWPSRPLLALDTLFPSFGNWMFRRTGVTRMMDELAARAAATSSGTAASPEPDPPSGSSRS